MNIQIDRLPPLRKVFFTVHRTLSEALETTVRIQRKEIGLECLLLNSFNLAALFTRTWPVPQRFPAEPSPSAQFESLRRSLPPWTVIVCLSGLPRHPEEKTAYEEEALRDLAAVLNVRVGQGLPGVAAADALFRDEFLRPWGILRKFNFRGSVHDLTFKVPFEDVPVMDHTVKACSQAVGYPLMNLGMSMIPLERGRGMHCEFDLHCDPEDTQDWTRTRTLWLKSSEELMKKGAFFDRPYGPWAPLVYNRAAVYSSKLRQIKKELDPHNILNPGKLCFS